MSEGISVAEQTGAPQPQPRRVPVAIPLSRPLWTRALFALNIVIWLVMIVLSALRGGGIFVGNLSVSSQVLVTFGAKVNSLIATGEFWRLLTANFLHVNLIHLLFNSYALWQIGAEVERVYGHRRFLAIYLLSGLYGTTASYALGEYLSVGASGAIFGLVGALVAYLLFHRDLFGRRGRAYLSNMLFIVAINLFIGISTPGIDNWGHIGGLVAGLLLGFALAPIYEFPAGAAEVEGVIRLRDVGSTWRHILAVGGAVLLLVAAVVAITWWQQGTASVLVLRAERALQVEDIAAAEEALIRALDREPDLAEAHFYLGVVRARQGKMREAAEAWERAARLDPFEPNTAWNLALAYQALGQREKAIAQLERYLTLVEDEKAAARARELLTRLREGP